MEEINKFTEEILHNGYVMSLGTMDDGGVWVADVVYIYDFGFNIYWISQISARHSVAIAENKNIAGTITLTQEGELNQGLQISGIAEKIDDATFEMLKEHLAKRGGRIPYKPIYYKDNKSVGAELSWYKLTPKKIELINEKAFGFEKQTVDLGQ